MPLKKKWAVVGAVVVALLPLVAVAVCCGVPLGLSEMAAGQPLYFGKIEIDTHTMRAKLSEPFPGRDPPQCEYYSSFRGAHRLAIYYEDGSKNLPYPVRYDFLDATHEGRVSGREKMQELAVGQYGTIYANTSFSYGRTKGSRLEVLVYANLTTHEPARVVAALPEPTPELGAISMVQVQGAGPDYLVAIAVYDPKGKFQRADIFVSKKGDWFQPEENLARARERATLSDSEPEAMAKYGLPNPFPVANYLKEHGPMWKKPQAPNPETIVNLHYDYNRWVRQDRFDEENQRSTRYLTYVVTPEDKILEPIDRATPFNQ